MLCNGHHIDPYIPEFQGLDQFRGKVIHSRYYKTPEGYQNKRIVVVGLGNTAGDIAVEVSHVARSVHVVSRRGNWLVGRLGGHGLPIDMFSNSRIRTWLLQHFPSIINDMSENFVNERCNHWLYGLLPDHRFYQQHFLVNDYLPNRIISGSVNIVRSDIETFTERGVVFKNGSVLEEVDVVSIATGFKISYPFLQEDIIPVSLYQLMYPPTLPHPTLVVIGLIQGNGAIPSIADIQSRVACSVFTRQTKLPPKAEMQAHIAQQLVDMKKRFVNSPRMTIEIDFIPYMDGLASMIGTKPKIFKRLFYDPYMAWKLVFGPNLPYVYRLDGPHKNPKAKELILRAQEKMLTPMAASYMMKYCLENGKRTFLKNIAMRLFFAIAFLCLLIIVWYW